MSCCGPSLAPTGRFARLSGALGLTSRAPSSRVLLRPLRRRRRPPPLPPPLARGRQSPDDDAAPWGNQNRLSAGGGKVEKGLSEVEASMLHSLDVGGAGGRAPAPSAEPAWQRALADKFGKLQYEYFNWRQDTLSDLVLFMMINTFVFCLGAWVEGSVIRNLDETAPPPPEGAGPLQQIWFNLYTVLSVVLGQDLPEGYAGWPSQLFAIVVAVFGLASFALILALIEQVVLEVLESNVKRGSTCYEQGHTVVLAYCHSSRGIAQITRILTQLCAANRTTGGGVVVVLTQQRGKLEMEQLFREVIPPDRRYGTRFVFRQGSPLDPAALRLVAVPDARSVIVCSDYSKVAKDADAQVLRTCVLVDEMVQQERPGQQAPIVAAQVLTGSAAPLFQYACSKRVIPVPTTTVNARRYVRILHHPIAAVFSRCISDFYSPAHGVIDEVPEVVGCTFGELHFRFPDAIVTGVGRPGAGYQLNPPPERIIEAGDQLVMLRAETVPRGQYKPIPEAPHVDPGRAWDPERYVLRSWDDQPLGCDIFSSSEACMALSARATAAAMCRPPKAGSSSSTNGNGAGGGGRSGAVGGLSFPGARREQEAEVFQSSAQGIYMLPVQYSHNLSADDQLLICGWMGNTFMWELLAEMDHSIQALPPGSRITLFNDHDWSNELLKSRCEDAGIRNLIIRHVRGDPRDRIQMQKLVDVTQYKGAIVVCDSMWAAPEDEVPWGDGALRMMSQTEMLSLDAAMLMIQLNIRLSLEEARHPNISIICEKLTYVGVTRFEDDARLPLGISVNSASFAAKTLAQAAVDPRFLQAYLTVGAEADITVQDSSSFVAEAEELSFLQLQARASSVRQVLLGWYKVPSSASEPLEMVVNPHGLEERLKLRTWNTGDGRLKLVTMAQKNAVNRLRETGGPGGLADFAGAGGDVDKTLMEVSLEQEPAVCSGEPALCDIAEIGEAVAAAVAREPTPEPPAEEAARSSPSGVASVGGNGVGEAEAPIT